jgi:serine/threonine protein kinase
MGAVYLARDLSIGRLVAIKLLTSAHDSLHRRRLLHEARAAGQLTHPNIVTVHHVDDHGDPPFIVMEYIEGRSLASIIHEKTPVDLCVKLSILEGICKGLGCAHAAGLVHRDIKPANVMVDSAWQPKIVDFGVALLPDASIRLTSDGGVVGTLSYMSPEQLSGLAVDHRSDLFSFAAMAYEVLSGVPAFRGKAGDVVSQILRGQPKQSRETRDSDPELDAVLRRALHVEPSERVQSAVDMAAAFAAARARLSETLAIRTQSGPPLSSSRQVQPPVENRGTWRFARAASIATLCLAAAASAALLMYGLSTAAEPQSPVGAIAADQTLLREKETASPALQPPVAATIRPLATTPPRAPIVEHRESSAPPGVAPGLPTLGSANPAGFEDIAQRPPLLPVGTTLTVRVTSELDSRRLRTGDSFDGVLDEPVSVGGQEVIARGTPVEGRIEGGGLEGGRPFLELSLTRLAARNSTFPLRTGFYRVVAPQQSGAPSFTAIVIGGIAGAAAGGLAAGGKGAAAGALGGATVALTSRADSPSEFYFTGRLPFRLAEAVEIDAAQQTLLAVEVKSLSTR